jgi:hypothetical protein
MCYERRRADDDERGFAEPDGHPATIPEKLKSKFPENVGHQNHGFPKKRFHTVIYHTKKPMYVSADVCMSHTHTHTHTATTHTLCGYGTSMASQLTGRRVGTALCMVLFLF